MIRERIFLAPEQGQAEEVKDQGKLRDIEAKRVIVDLLENDRKTQERFQKSGQTRENFINDFVRNFGENMAKNLTDLGRNAVMEELRKRKNPPKE